MNLIIFAGFLGAGKTSVLIQLAHYLVEKGDKNGVEIAIVENEIGEVGIDQKVLKTGGFSVKEMFAGCIYCQLTSDLLITLMEIEQNINPNFIILESTGLAYPGNIIETIRKYKGRSAAKINNIKSVTVVDAERWEALRAVTPFLIENQIKDADIILINKIDISSEEEIQKAEKEIKSINNTAELYKVSARYEINNNIWKIIKE